MCMNKQTMPALQPKQRAPQQVRAGLPVAQYQIRQPAFPFKCSS